MDLIFITIFILFSILFFIMISDNANINRCPYEGGKCYDGNGKYQYKGRGCKDEPVSTLINRIDWLAKNSYNKPLYSVAYIIAYVLALAVLVVLYATSCYVLSVWEYIIILLVAYIITFSLINLIGFHADRYPLYYIRNNISYIADKMNIDLKEPPHPCDDTKVPFRTYVRDKIRY